MQPDAVGKLVVEAIEPDSPAAKAGLKKGDIVVRLEKEPVGSVSAFRETLQAFAPGESINISILRNREPTSVKATLAATSRPIPLNQQKPTLGFEVGAAKSGGVPITRIVAGSPAERAKLKVGEVVLKIDGKQLSGPATLQEVLATKSPNDLVTLTLSLAGKSVDLEMPVGGEAVADGGGRGQGGRGGQEVGVAVGGGRVAGARRRRWRAFAALAKRRPALRSGRHRVSRHQASSENHQEGLGRSGSSAPTPTTTRTASPGNLSTAA